MTATTAVFLWFLMSCLPSSVMAAPNSMAATPEQKLTNQLQQNDIAGALLTAKATNDVDASYVLIAARQTQLQDFAGARSTIRRITVGSTRLPDPRLVDRCKALTTLAGGLYGAGRVTEARTALHVATLDAARIPNIFAEMGEGFGPAAGERWIDIADLQLTMRDKRQAAKSLNHAESFAAGPHPGYDAGAVLARIEKDRRILGDDAGAKRASREGRLAVANSNTDISVKAEALIDVDAEDSNAAGVLETVRQWSRARSNCSATPCAPSTGFTAAPRVARASSTPRGNGPPGPRIPTFENSKTISSLAPPPAQPIDDPSMPYS